MSALAFVACGDDSDSASNSAGGSAASQTLPAIERSYVITEENAELVIEDVDFLSMLSTLNQSFDDSIKEQMGNINATADCDYAGTVSLSGTNGANSANLVYSYQDCEDYKGKFNGQLNMAANVNQSSGTVTENVTGNLVYQYAADNSGQARTVAINDILQTIETRGFIVSTYQQANFTVSNAQDEGSYSMQFDGPAVLDLFSDDADESTHTSDITGADNTNIQIIQEGYSNSYLLNGEEF
jgi:hypothetical protein